MPSMLSNTDFCTGLAVGFVVAGILGFVLQQANLAYKKVKAAYQPQKVFHETAQTPNQVMAGSIRGGCVIFLLAIIVIGICVISLVVVQ
jgi:hypothetical protein